MPEAVGQRQADPGDFSVEAGDIDWTFILQLRANAGQASRAAVPSESFTVEPQTLALPNKATNAGVLEHGTHLHWSTAPEIGLPTGPFTVWRRPQATTFPVQTQTRPLQLQVASGANGTRIISWRRPLAIARLACSVPMGGGTLIAWSGNPSPENWVALQQVAAGTSLSIVLAGDAITGVMVSPGVNVTTVHGLTANTVANLSGWQAVERVGFPGPDGFWDGHGQHGTSQGFLVEAPELTGGLTTPNTAATRRYRRGLPVIGWPAAITDEIAAPSYQVPQPRPLLRELAEAEPRSFLQLIRGLMSEAPPDMKDHRETIQVPPPENSVGSTATTASTTAEIAPLELLLASVTTDPIMSLLLGFGTALPSILTTSSVSPGTPFDYMITADWRPDPASHEIVTRAALALRTPPALAGATPFDLEAEASVAMKPAGRDRAWRRSVRMGWEHPPETDLYRVASVAAAANRIDSERPGRLLNESHEPRGFLPIGVTRSLDDPEPTRLSIMDPSVAIAASDSPDQNSRQEMYYAAVTQTIFGLWGNWSATTVELTEPNPDRVIILDARLDASPVSSGPCPGTLVIDFAWDWSLRTPRSISFRSHLYAQDERSDSPESDVPTDVFPRSLGGNDAPIEVLFAGNQTTAQGASIVALNEAGDDFVAFGPAQGEGVRRYRMTIDDLSLDFDNTTHIGLALWARAVERMSPGRIGPWPLEPHLSSVSDPRPPHIEVDHVQLASLPDASGECHVRVSWPAVPNAAGYIIYESSETTLRTQLGLDERSIEATLSARRDEVEAALLDRPSRNAFTRRIAELVTVTSLDLTLPRGSTEIHYFTVLAQTAAGVPSEWPTGSEAADRLIAVAVPRIAKPQPPVLEVSRAFVGAGPDAVPIAEIAVSPQLGHRTQRVVLYRTRVDSAARVVDSMGPPIADVNTSANGWTVERASQNGAPASIINMQGRDDPDGSWRNIWYRAIAWSDGDPERGLLAARSEPSPARSIVIPPPGPPELSSLAISQGAGGQLIVFLSWSSPAPIASTPLGPHRMSIDVRAAQFPEPVLVDELALESVAPSQEVALQRWEQANGSDDTAGPPSLWWRDGDPDDDGVQTYRAIVRRPDSEAALSMQVHLRDPIGRSSEATASFDADDLQEV